MFRTILTPKVKSLTIELPQELIGKPVEILAFEITKTTSQQTRNKPSAAEISAFYEKFQINMSGFRFNREEANER